MPRINITKMDKHICEHCGKKIEESPYCEITTATNKVIKMHRECAKDFAVSILNAFSKEESLNKQLDRIVESYVKETPHAHLGVCESGEYAYYDILDYNSCKLCEGFCHNRKEERYECNKSHCARRDGER